MEEKSNLAIGRIPDPGFADDFRAIARGLRVGENDCEVENAVDGGGEHVLEILFCLGFLSMRWA